MAFPSAIRFTEMSRGTCPPQAGKLMPVLGRRDEVSPRHFTGMEAGADALMLSSPGTVAIYTCRD